MTRKARREADQAEYRASLERAEQALQEQRDQRPEVWFARTRYLGGHSKFTEGWIGELSFTTRAIGLRTAGLYSEPFECVIPMDTITSIQITGQQVSKSKVGPVLLFGLFGLAAKGSTHTTTVVVRTNDAETAYFSIPNSVPDAVKASLTPFLKALNIPFYEDSATQNTPLPAPDLADQIRKLAALRDDGLITDAEYETQKARLLNP